MKPRLNTSRVIWHHSLSKDVSAKTIREWHLERGFDDIGYHFVIRENGIIETGREERLIPAANKGRNYDSIAICITGDFRKGDAAPLQKEAAKAIYWSLCKRYGILKNEFHRGMEDAEPCPGLKFDRLAFKSMLEYSVLTLQEVPRKEPESTEIDSPEVQEEIATGLWTLLKKALKLLFH